MEVIMSSPVQECSEMKVDKGDNGPVKLINKEKKTSTHELGLKRWKESQKEKLASDGNLSRAKESQKEKLASDGNLGIAIESQKEKPASDGSLSKAKKKERKRISMKTSTTLGDILSTDESTKDTKKSLEALSTELKTKHHPKTANVDKGPSTDTVLAKTATTDKKMLVSSSAGITGDERSSISQSSFQDKAYSGIGATANLNAEVKVENKMETVVGEKGSGKNSTYNLASKKRKKREKKNPELGTTATVDQNSSVLTSSATGDEKSLISKVEASSGEMGLSKITNVNAEVKIENKMETTVGETGSGTNETDNTVVSNKRKRARKKKLILESDDVLSTLDYTEGKTTTSSEEKSSISRMEIDKGNDAVKLTKSQSLDKREDTENIKGKTQIQSISLSPVQDNPFSGIGSTATDNTSSKTRKRKTKKKNSPVSGDVLSTGEYTQVKIEDETETVVGETGSGTKSTDNSASKKRKKREKKNPESGTTAAVDQNSSVLTSSATGDEKSLISKVEASNGEMGLSKITNVNAEVKIENKMETTVGETGSGTNEIDNTVSKKRKRVRKKKLILESDDVLSTLDYTQGKTTTPSEEKSSISRIEIDKGNDAVKLTKSQSSDKREDTESSKDKTQIQSISLSPVQDNPFSVIGSIATDNTSSKTRKRKTKKKNSPVSGDVLSSGEYTQVKVEDKTETVVGETGSGTKSTDNSASKKRKKREKKNPESGTTATVDQNSSVLTSSATGAEKSLISKVETSSGELGSSMATKFIAEVKIENKIESTVVETGSGTNETDNTVSEKRKSQKINKKVQASVGILSTNECTQDTNESLEALSTELKTEDHPKTANLDKGPSTIVDADSTMLKDIACTVVGAKGSGTNSKDGNLSRSKESQKEKLASDGNLSRAKESKKEKLASDGNLSKVKKKKKRPKSKKTRITLGDILNPRYLELLEAGTNSKNLETRTEQKINNKIQTSEGIFTTDESTKDTNKSLEALSTELKTEDHLKTAKVEKGPITIVDADSTMLKDIACTEFTAISEPSDLEIAEVKENTSLPIKMVKQYVKSQEKKLVIFDVNGLLVDFVSLPLPKDMIADFRIARRAVFKRPFLDEFLSFCFERFHVGIWSSRTMKNLDPVVNFLFGDSKKKLLFLWDASKCTNSGMRTLEDRHKPLVLKDLRKIWEKGGPKGSFNDTNTLLLDDSPYKALVNPKHSGIFPVSYSCKNKDDNFLGPKGELQNYLEGLASCDDVRTYVEQHPFGQAAIDERHPQWNFYARVLKSQTR